MDPMEEMPVVVQCVLTREGPGFGPDETETPTPVQYLDLYYARHPSEAKGKVINDAIVCVSCEGEEHMFEWNGERWECAFLPQFEAEYKLDIRLSDNSKIQASTTFPPCLHLSYYIPLSAYGIIPKYGFYYFITNDSQQVGFVQESGKKRYDVSTGVFSGECFLWLEACQEGRAIERLCTSHKGSDAFNVCQGRWDDLSVYSDYKETYDRIQRVIDLQKERNPNGVDTTNFLARYLSFCRGLPLHTQFLRIHHPSQYESGLDWGEVEEDHLSIYKDPVVFNLFYDSVIGPEGNEFFSSQKTVPIPRSCHFLIDADFDLESDMDPGRYQTRFLSEDYDRYLRDICFKARQSDEFVQLYSIDVVYSNIQGGIGIFGCQWSPPSDRRLFLAAST